MMKITEKELYNSDFFVADQKNGDVNSNNINAWHYNLYHLKGTQYGILFSGYDVDWIEIYAGIIYKIDLPENLDNFSEDVKEYILFNLNLFR